MCAGLELQPGIGTLADDACNDFAVAAVLTEAFAENLDLPLVVFRVARIHAKQVAGKNGGFITTGAGADFQEDITVVVRVFRQQQFL